MAKWRNGEARQAITTWRKKIKEKLLQNNILPNCQIANKGKNPKMAKGRILTFALRLTYLKTWTCWERIPAFERDKPMKPNNLLNDRDELDTFKTAVNLPELATSFGWQVDLRDSTSKVTVLRQASGGKMVMTFGRNGQWLFKDCRTERHGSTIDFVMMETRESLGQIRKRLRAWLGNKPIAAQSHNSFPTSPSFKPVDREALQSAWEACKPGYGYLRRRGLSVALQAELFKDGFRQDARGNVVFPHFDRQGLCGLELRNVDFRGMKTGSTKAVWHSNNLKDAHTIVICESPIDCLSHYELNESDVAYVSFSGTLSTLQKELMTGLLSKADKRNCTVIIATDNDAPGQDYFRLFQSMTPMILERLKPIGKDWNDDLMTVLNEQG